MSGLPAAGKDNWIRNNAPDLPVVSLDAIRAEFGVDPADSQDRVIDNGRQRAKHFLREHKSFVWNASNDDEGLYASEKSIGESGEWSKDNKER